MQALFATIATALEAYADLMAARLVVLGRVALGTTHTHAEAVTDRNLSAIRAATTLSRAARAR